MKEIFEKYKSWALTFAGIALILLAGAGLRSCYSSVKERICKEQSGPSSPDSFW